MNISQGEGGTTSHDGTLNIDFVGWNESGRVYDCPMFAPCSLKCVAIVSSSNNGRVYESLNPVHTPNGLQYVCFLLMHDENPPSVGSVFRQGELFAHTGTAGEVTGDHTHMNAANGKYVGYHSVNGHIQLDNTDHIYNIMYVNDTVLVDDYNYNWLLYQGGHIPSIFRKGFKFVLYANKIRKRHNLKNK
jgi:hypothetical protein